MVRGAPDYGIYQRPAIAQQAFWEDDFEAPVFRWVAGSSAGSVNPVLSIAQQWKGVQSAYFATVGGAAEWSVIQRNFPLTRLGKVGVEVFILLENRTPGYFQIRLNIFDGTNYSAAELRLDRDARTATIITLAGAVVVATNCFPARPTNSWVSVKLVVDTVTDMFDRLFIGHQSIDLSAHALVLVAATVHSYIQSDNRLVGDVGGARDAYLDNFVLSQNEP